MRTVNYLKEYQFEHSRIIGISSRFQIYDGGFCVSNKYKTLDEAEESLKKFVIRTLGVDYESKIQL